MIRNVVVGRIRTAPDDASAAQDRAEVASAIAGILSLQLPGLVANKGGLDAGIREGGWDFAITNDWEDAASYHGYDTDPDHVGYRQRIGAVCEEIARVQFDLAGPASS